MNPDPEPDLFAWVNPHHHRASDPSTSRESACSARHFANGHAARCLAVIKQYGQCAQSEIAAHLGLAPHQVNKRLADLHNCHRIEPTGETRLDHAMRKERIWRIVA